MSDRLTYSAPTRSQEWPLLFPLLMLVLAAVAMIPFKQMEQGLPHTLRLGRDGFSLPMDTLALLLLLAQSGLLLRKTLPEKSSASLLSFASICGMGIPFLFLLGFLDIIQSPFFNLAGAALMISGWTFVLYAANAKLIWTVASGLTLGLACSFSPVCMSGAIALLFYLLLEKGQKPVEKLRLILLWLAAWVCGFIPALNGSIPLPLYERSVFSQEFMLAGLQFMWGNIPVWAWGFAALGLLIAILQRQSILLRLLLPYLVLRVLLAGFSPLEFWGIESTLLIPLAWLTAYGMLRVLRGIEQGVRNLHPEQAKKVPWIATFAFLAGFTFKIIDLYYFYS